MATFAQVWADSLNGAQAAQANGDAAAVIRILTPVAADPDAPLPALRLLASTLRSQRRDAQARPLLERVAALQPTNAVAQHNLGAALGDIGDASAAHDAAQRALALGGDAPETWLVLARAMTALSRLDEAEDALRQALARRPLYADALRDLAQLIWMRNGDAGLALSELDAAVVAADPHAQPGLVALRATVTADLLGHEASYRTLEHWLVGPPHAAVSLAAAAAACEFDPALALTHAQAAADIAPGDPRVRTTHLAALLAVGRAAEALPGLNAHLVTAPLDQYALALRFLAWRVLGDPRALRAEDYRALVGTFDLDPPDGLQRAEWLGRVETALARLHPFVAQPLGQSIRSGVQAALDPRFAGDADIDTVFQALERPIGRYIAAMTGRDDPMSQRAEAGHEIIGAWSVRLRAGGRHSDHVHPKGWVSSALYVATPDVTSDGPRAGWLRFGAARLGVGLELPAEHWIEPRPGRVALFPSWMWHGTEPFTGAGQRLSIAFDVQPR